MSEKILLVRGRRFTEISRTSWEKQVSQVPQLGKTRLRFMSEEHHRVRNFVVSELPRTGLPILPEFISQSLKLNELQVRSILDELENNLFFLVRNRHGAVSWAYPLTVEKTPHQLIFNTGEKLYGA